VASLGTVDRYELIEKLGQGAFGAVFRARDRVAGIDVALKSLPPQVMHSPEDLERVRQNFALVARLSHPNIAELLHLHLVEKADTKAQSVLRILPGEYLVVMEYVAGRGLDEICGRESQTRLPFGRALAICRQVGAALDYAHSHKIMHRDIKPSNIIVTDGGSVKVLDFGIAAEIRASLSRLSGNAEGVCGTPRYMAPEQWQGKRQTGATDQYALAVLLYRLVSGSVPFATAFDSRDFGVMRKAVCNRSPDRLPALGKRQNGALRRALAKDPADRFDSCAAFINAVSDASSRRPVWPAAALVSVLLLGVGTALLAPLWQGQTEPRAAAAAATDDARDDGQAEDDGTVVSAAPASDRHASVSLDPDGLAKQLQVVRTNTPGHAADGTPSGPQQPPEMGRPQAPTQPGSRSSESQAPAGIVAGGVPMPDCIALWRFDDGEGVVARESRDGPLNAIVNGANWVPGVLGKALEFHGHDYVLTPYRCDLGRRQGFSIGAWFRASRVESSQDRTIVAVSNALRAGTDCHIDLCLRRDGRLRWSLRDSSGNTLRSAIGLLSVEPLDDGVWHWGVGVVDPVSGQALLYVDGEENSRESVRFDGDFSSSLPLTLGAADCARGEEHGAFFNYFTGTIDEVAVYGRAPTPEQIETAWLAHSGQR